MRSNHQNPTEPLDDAAVRRDLVNEIITPVAEISKGGASE
jgi:hypothetical protein